MKRRTLRLLPLLLLTLFAKVTMAETVDMGRARQAATTFLNNNGAQTTGLTDVTLATGFSNVYVFTTENSFVLMAADDRVQPILGYSLTGRFDFENMPDNKRAWIEGYSNEIQYAIAHQTRASSEVTQQWRDLVEGHPDMNRATVVVAPLIQTQWDQGYPYNMLCPGYSMTGCVATAMAQIMKYWNYPAHGIGSHSYSHSTYGVLSADFQSTTYRWDKMTNTYNNMYSTNSQKQAVATLMYHCGVSVNMNYSTTASGANTEFVAEALKCFFNYSSETVYYERSAFANSNWIAMLKADLDLSRPILYEGLNSGGGHSFVFDGYDSDNYFHVNWGWSGDCDEYYSIDNLNPGTGGTGSGSTGIYNDNQGAVFHIHPSECVVNAPADLTYTQNGRQVRLSWSTATGASNYRIYCNNNFVGNTSATSYTTTAPYGSSIYYVRSADAQGYLSLSSNAVTVTVEYPTPAVDDLMATVSGNNVNLSWTTPWCFPETPTATLTYGSDNYYSCLGYNGTNRIYWGHRYPASSLSSYNNMNVYKVSFFANESGSYEVYVYKGTTSNHPQTKLLEQSFTVGLPGWYDIDLSTQIQIDASKDLWVFIRDPEFRRYPATYSSYSGNDANYYSSNPTNSVLHYSNAAFLIHTFVSDGTYTYNVYRDGSSIANNLTGTSYTDANVTNGVHYYYVKTNSDGVEWDASNQAVALIGNALVPWSEDFEELTEDGSIPEGWNNSETISPTPFYLEEGRATRSTDRWCYTNYNRYGYGTTIVTGHNDSKCVRYDAFGPWPGTKNFLKTPIFRVPTDSPMQLTFWYRNPSGGDFSVYISTDGGATHTTALVTGLTGADDWTWHDPIDLSAYAGQTVSIVFCGTSSANNGDAYIYLDDVVVSEVPSCTRPTALDADNITTNSARLSWSANNGETAWTLYYKAMGDSGYTEVANVTNPYTLDGLTASTGYQYYVVSHCTANDASEPSAEFSFHTDCETLSVPWSEDFENYHTLMIPYYWDNSASSIPYLPNKYIWSVYNWEGGNKTIRMYNLDNGAGTAAINTPAFELPSEGTCGFYFKYSNRKPTRNLIVKISEDGGATFTELASYPSNGSASELYPGVFDEAFIPLSDYAGETVIMQFFVEAAYDNGAVFVDDVRVSTILNLANDADNTTAISEADGQLCDVTLVNHTLFKDGSWNTICLPFELNDFSGTPLEGATVKTLASSTYSDDVLTMNFTNDLTAIEAGKPYIVKWDPDTNTDLVIHSAAEWNAFAANVNNGIESYQGKVVKLAADISVTTMVGTSSSRKFKGTFDGCRHTLTVNYTATDGYCAPFCYIENATIKNLRVTGTISTGYKYAAGIAARTYGNCNIRNCRSSVAITSSVVGDGTHGGLVTLVGDNSRTTISNCLFDGSITGSQTDCCGGFVGWRNEGTLNLDNCLMAGTMNIILDANSATFSRNGVTTLTNCYYKGDFGSATLQGTSTTATGAALQALLGDGWEVSGSDVVPKITFDTIVNPVFTDVTISSATANVTTYADFIGSYAPFSSNGLLLDANNPNGDAQHAALDIGEIETPTGYVLASWYTDAELTTPATVIPFADDGTVTLYVNIWPGEGDECTINSTWEWDLFCDALQDNDTYDHFIGKTVKLGADISVTRMAGSSGHEFMGTFDGQGHTLTVSYQNNDGTVRTAPFSYINGAIIQNLIVAGNITGTASRAAGIVGETGSNLSHVTNCVSSVNVSGGNYTGGISVGGKAEITGCVFNGTITGTNMSGGFVGYSNSALVISNCLFAPQEGSTIVGGTFYYNGGGEITPVNSYYTVLLGTEQGHPAVSDPAITPLGTPTSSYNVSNLTAYANGLMYGDTFYYDLDFVPPFVQTDTDEYTIYTATGWHLFCDALQDNDTYNRFIGKTVKLAADISVIRMAGGSYHDFMGTFEGQGHTLTVNYGSADSPIAVDKAAPFVNVEVGCIIKDLHVAGDIYTSAKYAGGLVGTQYGAVGIENCHISTVIHSSTEGDGTHGGIVGQNGGGSSSSLTITGCLFDGKLLTTGTTANCGGLVGWRSGTCSIGNSLYAPAAIAEGETEITNGSATFCRNGATALTNCYYTRTLGIEQGFPAISNPAITPVGEPTGTYNVSGLIAYVNGLMFGDTFYYNPERNFLLTIAGYGTGSGGWNLLASPIADTLSPTSTNGFLTNTYDLYRFNPSNEGNEWENYKAESFNLEKGKGYLYANSGDVTLVFAGEPYDGNGEVTLTYDADNIQKCWNLVGNPFPSNATLDREYYVLSANGLGINPVAVPATTPVPPFTAVFVKAVAEDDTVVFTKVTQ